MKTMKLAIAILGILMTAAPALASADGQDSWYDVQAATDFNTDNVFAIGDGRCEATRDLLFDLNDSVFKATASCTPYSRRNDYGDTIEAYKTYYVWLKIRADQVHGGLFFHQFEVSDEKRCKKIAKKFQDIIPTGGYIPTAQAKCAGRTVQVLIGLNIQ